MVTTSERPGEPKTTMRTYLLNRYVLSYTPENTLAVVFDLEDESWVTRGGRQTTLAYAEGFVERVEKQALRKWKERGVKDETRMQQALRPTFAVTEGEGRVTLGDKGDVYVVTPLSPPLPADVATRVHRYKRMKAYALAVGTDFQPYAELALEAELNKRSICPAAIDRTTAGPGTRTSRVVRTFSFEPLSSDQYARLQGLARQFQAHALSGGRD